MRAVALLLLAAGSAHSAPVACSPEQLAHVNGTDDRGTMCLDVARAMAPLVRLTAPCDAVVAFIVDTSTGRYFASCRVFDRRQRADRAVLFINYASVAGRPFVRVP